MKRKNILKFVSLLGIGSFVMLAAASCTKTTTSTPNPNTPSNGGGMTDSTSGGDINPGGNQGTTNAAAKELSDAKAALTTLLSNKSDKVDLYSDYAKIQNTLTDAYVSAETILQNRSATLEQVKNATSTLQTAINTADVNKQKFDQDHSDLIMPYKNLKAAITKKQTTTMELNDSKYSAILNHINSAFSEGEELVKQTLYPVNGNVPTASVITGEVAKIENAISESALKKWKDNADEFANYKSYTLDKTKLENMDSARNMAQPSNYSFVGYSVDITTNGTTSGEQNNIPNWNYAQRTIFQSNGNVTITNTTADEDMAKPLSNVSWIYSLAGEGTKYTLEFTYYGPSTGYLYFPYKLVKTVNANTVGLQYKLNDNETPTLITFDPEVNGKTPTVNDINVAKVTLANLKFGQNRIEFSVPADKVNPMIGNMYLSSSPDNLSKVYDDIFGNSVTTEENKTKVSVNTLSAYSLAADWSTFIGQYEGANLTLDSMEKPNQKYYLIGYVGGTSNRNGGTAIGNNQQSLPLVNNTNNRNYIFYVNAPKEGDYYVKGIYASGEARKLKFTTGDMSDNHVTIDQLNSGNYNTMLKTFDTSLTTEAAARSSHASGKKTLTLVKGLNKIVVNGDGGDAPNFGHLEFILKQMQPEATSVSTLS